MSTHVFSQAEIEAIECAIKERRSVRAFLDTPVPQEKIEHILALAARAPSGTNIQPWRVYALAGQARKNLSEAILASLQAGHGDTPSAPEYKYYPDSFFEPYLSRRRKIGVDLYGLAGVRKGDVAGMARQHARNYTFFDAPVGLIFTLDRRLQMGSWIDYGYFLATLGLAARAQGLESCSQASFAAHHGVIREVLGLAATEIVLCGMALGYADADAPVNRLRTERAPLEAFASFSGF